MSLFTRLVARAAQELRQNPEARAKASEILEDDVKPRAKEAWKDAQPKIADAKRGVLRFMKDVRDEYRKGRDGE